MKRLVTGVVIAGVLIVASPLPTSLAFASPAASTQQAAVGAPTPNSIVATAQQYLGAPYATIGNTPSGFSCIGFVNFVFAQNGVNVPFDIPMAWASAPHVSQDELLPGDVLFYSNTVFPGLSHVGIYIGNGEMIGADNFAVGVHLDNVNDSYWSGHYFGATRPLAQVGTSPMPGTGQGLSMSVATPVSTPSTTPVVTPVATPTQAAQVVVANAAPGSILRPLTARVQVYSGPGYQYTPISMVNTSVSMTVLQAQASWYNVRFNGTYGWVSATNVRAQSSSTQQAEATRSQPLAQAAAVSTTAAGSTMIVLEGPLWLRAGPGKTFGTVTTLTKGTKLKVVELRSGWVHVMTSAGRDGWVASQYVAPDTTPALTPARSVTKAAPASGSTTSANSTVRVTATMLNVRATPDNHARVITVLFQGERVQMVGHQGSWAQIRLKNNDTGWVSSSWISAN